MSTQIETHIRQSLGLDKLPASIQHDSSINELITRCALAISMEKFELIPKVCNRFLEMHELSLDQSEYRGYKTQYHELMGEAKPLAEKPKEASPGYSLLADLTQVSSHFLKTLAKAKAGAVLGSMGPYVSFVSFLLPLLSEITSVAAAKSHYQNGIPPGEASLCLPVDANCEEGFFADVNGQVLARFKRTLVELSADVTPEQLQKEAHCMRPEKVGNWIDPYFSDSQGSCSTTVTGAVTQNIQPGFFFSATRGTSPNTCSNAALDFQDLAKSCVPPEPMSTKDIILLSTVTGGVCLITIGAVITSLYLMQRRRAQANPQQAGERQRLSDNQHTLYNTGTSAVDPNAAVDTPRPDVP